MPIDHVSLPVSDVPASRKFYLAALKPLNYQTFMVPVSDCFVGLNTKFGGPDFWIHKIPEGSYGKEALKTHVAFCAKSQRQVREFYEAAL
jgi:catechol 2,3-dioxygenase-like lactoylglutathione lyase family enzyme